MTIQAKFTSTEIMEVCCIECDAKVGERCCEKDHGTIMLGFHSKRLELREKLPAFHNSELLSSTDKSLIAYYAFVMLADSCEAKSVELFGRHFDSVDIQRFFAARAVQALKKEGLLK